MNKNECDVLLKALGIFQTMRFNLATVDSFLRGAYVDVNLVDIDKIKLGFLGIASSKQQIAIHNTNITTIIFALLFKSLQNYFEIVTVNPKLRDIDLENTISDIGCSNEVIESMRAIRNNIFHVPHIIQIRRARKAL